MDLEKAIRMLNYSQSQMRLGNLPDYSQNVYQSIEKVLQELDNLQKENEELKKGNEVIDSFPLVRMVKR